MRSRSAAEIRSSEASYLRWLMGKRSVSELQGLALEAIPRDGGSVEREKVGRAALAELTRRAKRRPRLIGAA